MGCTESKLDKDDTVRRCKERRCLMKEAVYARHHLASAHSDYCRSLRATGSALVTFASGESLLHVPPPPPSPSTHPPPMSTTSSSHQRKPPIKLPHILSDSTFSSSPCHKNERANSTYSALPSIWNWDNFYPPSPPDSDYFDRASNASYSNNRSSNRSSHSHYSNHNNSSKNQSKQNTTEFGKNVKCWENKDDREEAECSQWGDHYIPSSSSSSSSSSTDNDEESRSEPPAADAAKPSDGRIVVRHKDLSEVFEGLRESFDTAAKAGEPVSDMLEAGRAQLDRSFKHLTKTIYHSSGMLSNLSSGWTSKPPLAVKYIFDPSSFEKSNGPKSLCVTLERLLAWEKKLYQEVKARECVRIEHEKKLSILQSQEHRGEDEAKLVKTKASIKRLQSLMLVTSQAVSTTSSAIATLRDSHLVPQLVELCHGFMYMWRSMNGSHEIQNQTVRQVHCLVAGPTKGKPTSDRHHLATSNLDSTLSTWHSSFCRMIQSQRTLVRSLHAWFKLTQPTNKELSSILKFFDEWKLASERVPDTAASGSIRSLNNVVHSIYLKQTEELKIERRAGIARKELEKKTASLRSIEKKYYQSYSMVGIGAPDENGRIPDVRDPLAEKRAELAACRRRVEDEMVKHSKAVEVTRAMTLNNIQMGLPGVFQAMTSFSSLVTESLETVCTCSYAI